MSPKTSTSTSRFLAFIPLSNWLRGFDRYRMVYSKTRIPESSYPDAFYLLKEEEDWSTGIAKVSKLIDKLGLLGDRILVLRSILPTCEGSAEPNIKTGTNIGWRWPKPEIPLSGLAWLSDKKLIPVCHEEVTAQAYLINDPKLFAWSECRPRTFSILPIAKACQASCRFCFSKASVSDLVKQHHLSLEEQIRWAEYAKLKGATRAVITGGGEPTLLSHEKLSQLIQELHKIYASILLITNGSQFEKHPERISDLASSGLTTLALSRHGTTALQDAEIMGLKVDFAQIANMAAKLGLRTRAICVLQKGGVENHNDLKTYLERAVQDGFQEVCCKELYVSSTLENSWAAKSVNRYCQNNQIPLTMVLESLYNLGFQKIDQLPWGSPVFQGQIAGQNLKVAAYTEPSVGWERTSGIVRSWNLLSDGTCLASLEDSSSILSLPEI